jgi:anaerobic selenocysteine-containing dehydrogenase
VLSTPNGRRLDRALVGLDFMVSIDLYVNETTRHADVVLPPAWGLAEDHVDLMFANYMVRNVARWSPPVVERGPDERSDWEILLALAERLGGGPSGNRWLDGAFAVAKRFGFTWHPDTMAELALRTGRHGDGYLPWSSGLNRKKLAAAPHGIDLVPLETGIARRVFHTDGKMQLATGPSSRRSPTSRRRSRVRPRRTSSC